MTRVLGVLVSLAGLLASAPAAAAQEPGVLRAEPVVTPGENELLRQVLERERSDRRGAIAQLRAGITPASSAALDFTLGALLIREGRHEEAEQAFLAATRKFPSFGRAFSALGRVRVLRERAAAAVEALAKAIELGHDTALNWKLLGQCHLLAGRSLAAETAYRRSLVLAPDDGEAFRGLVRALLDGGRCAEAIPLLRESCRREPGRRDTWLLLANAHLLAQDPDGALEVLETARRLVELGPEALLTLGDLCYRRGLYGLAVARYGEAGEGKADPGRLLDCAEAFLFLGRLDEAAGLLERLEVEGPGRPGRVHLLRGRLAERRGDPAAAKAAFEAALAADPLSGEAMLGLAGILLGEKDRERARIVLERAVSAGESREAALVLLAQVEVDLGETDRAIERLEEALAIRPDSRLERTLEQLRRLAR